MTLHHRPQGAAAEEDQQRQVRLRVMEAIYRIFFKAVPLKVRPKARRYSSAQVPQDPTSVTVQSPQDPISVTVKSVDGKVWQVEVRGEDSVERLKGIIQAKGKFPVDQQKMVFVGRELQDSLAIKDYGITQGSVIYLVLRLKGC